MANRQGAALTPAQALQQALSALQRGEAAEAERLCRCVLAADPASFEAHFLAGIAAGQSRRPEDAARSFEGAVRLRPAHADAWFNLGVARGELGRHVEALAAYDRAVTLDPGKADAHYNRGAAFDALGGTAEALAAYERALALQPGHAQAHHNRGVALARAGRAGEALAAFERELALRPAHAAAHVHRAIVLNDLDRPAEALAACDRALALAPEHASAHWNLADCRLILGDFARGWEQYEWRWKLPARRDAVRAFAQPLWLGGEPLAGRTILLHAELGLGDTLQFCRYATEVARSGARVVLETQRALVPLLATLEGVEELVARGDVLPDFDCHCPLLSLPLAFRSDVGSVPASVPYLKSDPARVEAWRGRLGAATRPRVGLAWSGSQGLANDKRSMALADALPLLDPGIEWVSLQKEVRGADAALLAAHGELRDASTGLGDFADTAALIELLDLVVTADTSVAHVAGALGKPVWILLPSNPHDWRWLLACEDSIWYPTARLFRQGAPGDWAGVVARVAGELKALLHV